ncbi:hypothetical protein O7626_19875 [Micromonospora sp. WMMD1102]|uniref:hypothetical protein n=1 Tax=Micromonospora sp. WMMD1102 TaxID=3016105 RepID=UPI0024151462|nr:hypothetical protein [Micromonospora sp. WMMD1102]MDG4788168.1 hypothetical protein [Micromonospora sp. WMMD1102]
MIRLWHVPMRAGLLVKESDPPQGGLVGLVTILMERLGVGTLVEPYGHSGVGNSARAVRGVAYGTPRQPEDGR